jgi:hypothetical protein
MDLSAGPTRLKARTRVGSSGTAVHYAPSDRAFHPTDVPQHARLARQAAREHSSKTEWDSTCTPARGRQTERYTLKQHAASEFTYNYRAETLPPLRPVSRDPFGRVQKIDLSAVSEWCVPPLLNLRLLDFKGVCQSLQGPLRRVQEMPTHPALDSKMPWSATPLTPRQYERSLSSLTTASLSHTAAVRGALLSRTQPTSLLQRERAFMEHLRAVREGTGATALGRTVLLGGHSSAAAAAAAGGVGADAVLGSIPLDALQPSSRLPAGQLRVTRKYAHDGSYGPAVGAADAGSAGEGAFWSCCGATDKDSKGCRVSQQKSDRYCYDSPFGR